MKELLNWINDLNKKTYVRIDRTVLNSETFWYYDDQTGGIKNRRNSFFSIMGIKGIVNGIEIQQPIIIQNEIGYLGIICKDFNGITKYLMQAKIEPGNINCVQISPTIQATKSNFTQLHGGKKPHYLEYFINANDYEILADQIQSEQSSRFYKKRNRNMIIKVKEDIEIVNDNFKWMSLSEIKQLMKYENLVNMDTRTVLSCVPFISCNSKDFEATKNSKFWNSFKCNSYYEEITEIYHKINNYKMFSFNSSRIVRLDELDQWESSKHGVKCKSEYPYEVIFCDIEIEGREVTKWIQPLFKANGRATFGLFRTMVNGIYKFLVKIVPEIGCFDGIEIGPTIQLEYGASFNEDNIQVLFKNQLKKDEGIVFDSILSEEGGRFYHEENRNLIIDIDYMTIKDVIPKDYILVSLNA
ncbi:MAG: NDP-hexose 2,3-dehydratase family protein, partial [Carnobacterium sp.]